MRYLIGLAVVFGASYSAVAQTPPVIPATGLWSSEQMQAVMQICAANALYDNAKDKDLISNDALAFFCGCVSGAWAKQTAYDDFVKHMARHLRADMRVVNDCKKKGLATKPVSIYGKLHSAATDPEWASLESESRTMATGLFRLRDVERNESANVKTNAELAKKPARGSRNASSAPPRANLGVSTETAFEPAAASQAQSGRITREDTYADVMKRLDGIAAKKSPYGDFLDVEYGAPELLAYPDAGGTCTLKFSKGVLWQCSGCNPAKFDCSP